MADGMGGRSRSPRMSRPLAAGILLVLLLTLGGCGIGAGET